MGRTWIKIVRIVFAAIYVLSWLAFSLGFIFYYPMLNHIRKLQLMDSAGAMILLPMLSFLVPGLGIGVLLVFHIISKRTNRKHLYMALIMLFSVPYLSGGGVNILMASAFLGTLRNGVTKANGVPVEWVVLVLAGSIFSIASYWVSVIIAALSHRTKSLYTSRELIRTSEYERLP